MGIDRAVTPGQRMHARRLRSFGVLSLLAAALVFGSVSPASAQAPPVSRVVQVEAAFLVNFLRYTDWPPQRFAGPTDPYVVTVVGSADVAATISAVASAAGEIRGRRIEVRRAAVGSDRVAFADALRGSHLVFVHASARDDVGAVLGTVRGQPVLTVGDVAGFTGEGGMLGLVQSRSHLAFEANPAAIHQAGIQVSAKVLKLARIRGAEG